MRAIITQKEEFKAKDGKEYVKASAINSRGASFEIFTVKENFYRNNFNPKAVLTEADMTELFEKYETVSIDFDNTGRFVGIEN